MCANIKETGARKFAAKLRTKTPEFPQKHKSWTLHQFAPCAAQSSTWAPHPTSLLRAPGHWLPLRTSSPVAHPARALRAAFGHTALLPVIELHCHSVVHPEKKNKSKQNATSRILPKWLNSWTRARASLQESGECCKLCVPVPWAVSLRVGWAPAAAEQSRLVRMPEGESWALPLFFSPPTSFSLPLVPPCSCLTATHASTQSWHISISHFFRSGQGTQGHTVPHWSPLLTPSTQFRQFTHVR